MAGFVAVAALLGLTAGYLALLGGPAHRPGIGGPFELTSADGATVTDRSFAGRYLLVYFGYSDCPDICPITLSAMGDALDRLGARADRIQPLFITVDPQRDTPAVLGRYVAEFSPRLVGLTGSAQQLHQVQQEYRVSVTIHHGGADDMVDHSSVVYLMAPDGRFVAPIAADASGSEMAASIAKHML